MNAYTTIEAAPEPTEGAPGANRYTQRHDGWTPERRRAFLEHIADGVSVANACKALGLSESSAYALRRRAAGQEFALGWQAANLIARDRFAETLTDRALEGYEETVTRADGSTVTRFRFDNRLAHAMLTRLDRYADQAEAHGSMRAARLIAGEFDAYLDLVEQGAGAARAGLFLARRSLSDAADPDLATLAALARADRYHRTGASLAEEVSVADLDPAARSGWTAEQWQRAEAAGLLTLAAPATNADDEESAPDTEDTEDRIHLWQEAEGDEWRTNLPPPPGFDGWEQGEFGDHGYWRELSEAELALIAEDEAVEREEQRARAIALYPQIFGFAFPEAEEEDAADQDTDDGGEADGDAGEPRT